MSKARLCVLSQAAVCPAAVVGAWPPGWQSALRRAPATETTAG